MDGVATAAPFEPPRKKRVVSVDISATSYTEVAGVCAEWIAGRHKWLESGAPFEHAPKARYICVVSVHGIMMSRQDGVVRRAMNGADIATPDGMPVVWALRSFGEKDQQRVYGPNLMLRLCGTAAERGARVFLYGGRPDTLAALKRNLTERFPQLIICGEYCPPFRPLTAEEEQDACALIKNSRPDLLFVGISTPKQDLWMERHRDLVPGMVMAGVGAAFDFHAGRVRQAPGWVQRNGLEWLFRLAAEPVRLWKRYLLVTPAFLPLWAMQKAGLLRQSE